MFRSGNLLVFILCIQSFSTDLWILMPSSLPGKAYVYTKLAISNLTCETFTLRKDSPVHCLSSSQTALCISSFHCNAQSQFSDRINAVQKLHLSQPLNQHAYIWAVTSTAQWADSFLECMDEKEQTVSDFTSLSEIKLMFWIGRVFIL